MIKKTFYSVLTLILFTLFITNADALCTKENTNYFDLYKGTSDLSAVCTYDSISDGDVIRNITIYKENNTGDFFVSQETSQNEVSSFLCIHNDTDSFTLYATGLDNNTGGAVNPQPFYINTTKYESYIYDQNSSDTLTSFRNNLNSEKCPMFAGYLNGSIILTNNLGDLGKAAYYGEKVTLYSKLISNSVMPSDPSDPSTGVEPLIARKIFSRTKSVVKLKQSEQPTTETEKEPEVDLTDRSNLCTHSATLKVLKIARKLIQIIKILVPLALIVMGTIECVKAVISQDQDSLSKAFKSITKKVFIGMAIFFIPLLIDAVVNLITDYDKKFGDDSNFYACKVCFFGDKDLTLNTCNQFITSLTGEEFDSEGNPVDDKNTSVKKCDQVQENGYADYALSQCTVYGERDDNCIWDLYQNTTLKNSYVQRCKCENRFYLETHKISICSDKNGNVDGTCLRNIMLFNDAAIKQCKCMDNVYNGVYKVAYERSVYECKSENDKESCKRNFINNYINENFDQFRYSCVNS